MTACVTTLIATSGRARLDRDAVAAAQALLPRGATPRVLSEGRAVDLPFTLPGDAGDTLQRIAIDVRSAIGTLPVDVVVQPEDGRRKALLIADMDSTMIGQECIDELAAELGLKDKIATITERAMRGEIDFEPALRERVALLKGLDASVVDTVIAERITLTPGGPELVRTMRANGGFTALVSGGFTLFTSVIAERIGFDTTSANILNVEDGKLAGTVAEPILGRQAKLDALRAHAEARGLSLAETMAVGDGANDLAMIEAAGMGVAFRAKPAVAAKARAQIHHSDLTALLYMQGYTDSEIVSA